MFQFKRDFNAVFNSGRYQFVAAVAVDSLNQANKATEILEKA